MSRGGSAAWWVERWPAGARSEKATTSRATSSARMGRYSRKLVRSGGRAAVASTTVAAMCRIMEAIVRKCRRLDYKCVINRQTLDFRLLVGISWREFRSGGLAKPTPPLFFPRRHGGLRLRLIRLSHLAESICHV